MASDAQVNQRRKFTRAVACFRKQPDQGGVEPPALGPRNRSWWYDESTGSGMFYYNYFMQQTLLAMNDNESPEWCVNVTDLLQLVEIRNSDLSYRNPNPSILQLNRGENSSSGIFNGSNSTRVYLALGKANCLGMFPSLFLSKITGTDFPFNLFIAPYNGTFDFDTVTWATANIKLDGPYTQNITVNGQSVMISMAGFPIIDDVVYFIVGVRLPSLYVQPFLNGPFNNLWLEY
jgi:hypothetical protein